MNTIKKTALIIFFILIITVSLAYGPALLQEGNPFKIVQAIVTLEFSSKEIVAVEDRLLIQKSGSEEPLTSYLKNYGWSFSERLGSGLFYQKNNDSLFVYARMLTSYYIVYETDREYR